MEGKEWMLKKMLWANLKMLAYCIRQDNFIMVLWINIFIWQIFAHQHFEVEKQLNKLFCI